MNGNNEILKINALSEEEQKQFSLKLMELLKWQTEKYNGLDSTSIATEKANELLESLLYTISFVCNYKGITISDILSEDFKDIIRSGQAILEEKRKEVKLDWGNLCLEAPPIKNSYFISTLKSIGEFFNLYDVYYASHEIPCSIDYPLLLPISESIKGISYIEEYINRVNIENMFINKFNFDNVLTLIKLGFNNYLENYFNLCEPVFINAIGKKVIKKDIEELVFSENDILLITDILKDKSKDEIFNIIKIAFEDLRVNIGFYNNDWYFEEEIKALATRCELAVKSECLYNVFIRMEI